MQRILLFVSPFHLVRELLSACQALGVIAYPIDLSGKSLEDLLQETDTACRQVRPDFALTVNHFGVDAQGVLLEVLRRHGVRLASWFVDSPQTILRDHEALRGPWTTAFCWDRSSMRWLQGKGFEGVHHLPLATDPTVFHPAACSGEARVDAAFVGTTWLPRIARRLRANRFPRVLLRAWRDLGARLAANPKASVRYLASRHAPQAHALLSGEGGRYRHAFEGLVVLEATRRYRLACVRGLLGLSPRIAGDACWRRQLGDDAAWTLVPPVDYYTELPGFYASARVNLNCTSLAMRTGVNQRVFDAPACGGFLLTDRRSELEELFEPGEEVAVYDSPEEVAELARYYLARPELRWRIVGAARRRILAEHTYEHRVARLCALMAEGKATFSGKIN
jgi:spore maturation protein CgeB